MAILVLNAGSSSLKFGLFDGGQDDVPRELSRGGVESIGSEHATLSIRPGSGTRTSRPVRALTLPDAADRIFDSVADGSLSASTTLDAVTAVGYRVVHGGHFDRPVVIDEPVVETIRSFEPLAPLHNANALEIIESARRRLPHAAHVAVFDTAFHAGMPAVASTYAIPFALAERDGLRRYGFHGISHSFASRTALRHMGDAPAPTKVITCHLGNGSSLCAVRDGRSIDTSMGLTPLEGLVMGTRSGDVDAGLVFYLERNGMNVDSVDHMLNFESGMLGVSGVSADVRDIEKSAASGNARAAAALEMFAYRASKYIGAYAVALEGLDALVYTGGIGENSATTRTRICSRLGFLGIALDPAANEAYQPLGDARISSPNSRVQVWVVPADEEFGIAIQVVATVGTGSISR